MDTPYTKLRPLQYRGPSTSDDYNSRIQENYRDLLALINQAQVLREVVRDGFGQLVKDHYFIAQNITSLQGRIATLELNAHSLGSTLHDSDDTETNRFTNTPFQVATSARLTRDPYNGLILLPRIDSSSVSKLSFTDQDGNVQVPSGLEMRVSGDSSGADTGTAVIDTSDPTQAVAKAVGRVWERNVIVSATNGNGAIMTAYLQVPVDLFTSASSNVVLINPYPVFSVDILEVAYTTSPNIFLQDSDGYVPINSGAFYTNNTQAINWVAPGGWTGDTILNSPPRAFYFDPQPITGLRIKLRQRTSYHQGSHFVYSYGLSLLDLRYEKFLSTGVTMVKVTPQAGQTISKVTSVQPQIYNVAESELPDVFSYRVIWETSFNSGIYTLSPVPNSQRAWIEVTLNSTANNGTPALSGLSVSYS